MQSFTCLVFWFFCGFKCIFSYLLERFFSLQLLHEYLYQVNSPSQPTAGCSEENGYIHRANIVWAASSAWRDYRYQSKRLSRQVNGTTLPWDRQLKNGQSFYFLLARANWANRSHDHILLLKATRKLVFHFTETQLCRCCLFRLWTSQIRPARMSNP